jgi:cupin superfamily acireductone dioxygenase involved in methionine salvage
MQTHTHTRARAHTHTHSRIQYFVLGGAHFNELEKNYELFGLFVWEGNLVHNSKIDDFFSLHTLKTLQFHHISSLYPTFLQNLHNNLSTVQNNTLKKLL